MSERDFGELLTEGIRYICARENKQLQIVQDELGYAVGRQGSSIIRYWRQGHWPSKLSDVEILARLIVQRGRVTRAWLERFLESADFANATQLCDELFPNRHYQHLPASPTKIIGRDREATDLIECFRHGRVRLMALTGAPGVGKTRLALHVAAELGRSGAFQDGIIFAPLASIREPERVMMAIANAVGLMDDDESSLKARLSSYLQERNLLLVLDNFEQVITAAPCVADLLTSAPCLKILVTSREPLHIYGEHEYPVLPLAAGRFDQPVGPEVIAEVPAVQLFVERTGAVNPGFLLDTENAQVVLDICTRLDGLPLAIELAAAQSKWLTPPQLLNQLSNRFALLVNGPRDLPARQQTLQASVEWSYELLSVPEKGVLRRLSVFMSGCTLEAIGAVCVPSSSGADRLSADVTLRHLQNLIDKGLVQRVSSGVSAESRYLLLETIREYAGQKLFESGEAAEVQRCHRDWYVQLAEQARQNLRGADQLLWVNRLEEEIHNFRKALAWCMEHPAEIEPGLRLVVALNWFWHLRSRLSEGCDWLNRLLAIKLPTDAPRSTWQARAQALEVAGALYGVQRNSFKAKELAEASLELFNEIGDEPGIVSAKINLGYVACLNGDMTQGVTLAEETLPVCQANADRFSEAQLLDTVLGEVAFIRGEYARATVIHEASLALRRDLRDIDGIAWSSFLLARNVHALGDMGRAQQLYEEARELWKQLGNRRWYSDVLHELGELAIKQGDYSRATALFEESLTTARSYGDPYSMTRALSDLQRITQATSDNSLGSSS